MNKDLIIKLAKLANNNPNDNEANAAARKVCHLLAEGNFDFGIVIERTKTPDFKSTPPKTPSNPSPDFSKVQWDFNSDPFREMYEQYFKYGGRDRDNPHYKGPQYYPFTTEEPSRPEKTNRVCSKCGRSKLTARVTAVFTCNECEWTGYQQTKDIHACEKCSRKQWLHDKMNRTYICLTCGNTITEITVQHMEWRMG